MTHNRLCRYGLALHPLMDYSDLRAQMKELLSFQKPRQSASAERLSPATLCSDGMGLTNLSNILIYLHLMCILLLLLVCLFDRLTMNNNLLGWKVAATILTGLRLCAEEEQQQYSNDSNRSNEVRKMLTELYQAAQSWDTQMQNAFRVFENQHTPLPQNYVVFNTLLYKAIELECCSLLGTTHSLIYNLYPSIYNLVVG